MEKALVIFEGRSISGIILLFSLGVVSIIGGLYMLAIAGGILVACAFAILLLVLSIPCLYFGFKGLGVRRVEIDNSGLNVFHGGKLEWGVLWNEVRSIGTYTGEISTGIVIQTDTKTYCLSSNEIGPISRLREVFREIVVRANHTSLSISDPLDWATDIINNHDQLISV